MKEKKINIYKIILLFTSILCGLGLGIWRIVFNLSNLNVQTMQYIDGSLKTNVAFTITYVALLAIFVVLYFIFKSKLSNDGVKTTTKFTNIISGVLILLISIVSIISLFTNKNIYSIFQSESVLCKIFIIVSLILLIVNGLYFTICDFKPKAKTYFSYFLPFAPIFIIVASFFSSAYTVVDSNRVIYNLALGASALVLLNISQINISEKPIKTSYIFSVSSILLSIISLSISLGITIFTKSAYTTIFTHLEYVLIGYLVISCTYAIKNLPINKKTD